jgi:hypothetical protein
MKHLYLITIAALLFGCAADEAEPEVTHRVAASFGFTDTDTWPERYQITMGAFAGTSITPLAYVNLTKPADGVTVDAVLNVPEKADNIQLYVANSAHQIVSVFYKYALDGFTADVSIPHQPIGLVSYTRVQGQVFVTCIACHGGASGLPAANLNLTEGQSHSNLIDVTATFSTKKRVVPNDTAQSFIIDVLRERNLTFAHTASMTIDDEDVELLKKWIVAGAAN